MSYVPEHFQRKIDECKDHKLIKLDLSNSLYIIDSNKLTEVPTDILGLSWLKILKINYNNIQKIPDNIQSLARLTNICLISNKIKNIPDCLSTVNNLLRLNLSNNQLTSIPDSLGNLSKLTYLDLSNNQLTSIPDSLGNLNKLIYLDLSNNQLTSIPDSLGNLNKLTYLDLSNNQLTSIPDSLGNLSKLTYLNLSDNKLINFPRLLSYLTRLTYLDFSRNQVAIVPDFLISLENLSYFNLSDNQIEILPDFLGYLANLYHLNLSDNQILIIPDSLNNLKKLTTLYLMGNRLKKLPDYLGDFNNLTSLNVLDNDLKTIPESLGRLTKIVKIDFSFNWINDLPISLNNLSRLTEINLSYNLLRNIPESLIKLPKLTRVYLERNPLEDPPIEIASQGIEAIREYFRQKREAGEDKLYEAKLIIIGEGEAGKTTLARRIDDPNSPLPSLAETTEGIDVKEWHFITETGTDFRINIWDFGGQEIYHETHQFFLTCRSLYALVIDSRKDNPNLPYWLNIVELLSDNSPILLIKNEKNNYTVNISETDLKGRFANIKEGISCNFADNRGLEDVVRAIRYHIQKLPHVGSSLPKTWIKVRETIEQDSRNYISLEEYLAICTANGFKQEKDCLQLSQYLHDIGVVLHFQDNLLSRLYHTIILKPEWGTEAVYKILRSSQVKQNRGKFNNQDLGEIWQAQEYAKMRGELLDLMMKFKLCYELPNQAQTYITPQLLSLDPPEQYNPHRDWNRENNLILRYKYSFMPKGIITRLIVVMHRLIVEPKVWRTGVIFKRENTLAEVVEVYDQQEIRIRIVGANQRGFLEVITEHIDNIHASYHRLKVDKLIPCNCSDCSASQKPYFYKLETIKKAIGLKRTTIECQESFDPVNIEGLIESIPLSKILLSEILEEKLEYLESQLAIQTDPNIKFQLTKDINEIKNKLRS